MAESEAAVPLSTDGDQQQINNNVEIDDEAAEDPKNTINNVDTDDQSGEDQKKKLKHLEFVQVALVYIFVCCAMLYESAKANSGPLKHGVLTVEAAVKTVIGPVYEKFHDVPFDLLKFVDTKVDESVEKLDHHIPGLAKQILLQALTAAQNTPQATRELFSEIHRTGLLTAASNTANTMYATYEPVAEQYLVLTWRTLDGLPLFSQVAHIMVPTASYWAEKYNRAVAYMAEEGYAVSDYMPLVPVERIAKMFEGARGEDGGATLPNGS